MSFCSFELQLNPSTVGFLNSSVGSRGSDQVELSGQLMSSLKTFEDDKANLCL